MDMQGNRYLSVTQQQAWDALNDPEILKSCIPGCEKFEQTAENEYGVTVAVKIGPVSAKFNGKVKLGGKIAQLGQRLIDGVAKSLAEDFFKRFDEALQAKYPRVEGPSDPVVQPVVPQPPVLKKLLWPVVGLIAVGLLVWYFKR